MDRRPRSWGGLVVGTWGRVGSGNPGNVGEWDAWRDIIRPAARDWVGQKISREDVGTPGGDVRWSGEKPDPNDWGTSDASGVTPRGM